MTEQPPPPGLPYPSATLFLQSVGAAVLIAVIWIVMAMINPTTTYHLSPVLVAAAPSVVLRMSVAGRAPWRQITLAAVTGAAVAALATMVLVFANALRGPVLTADFATPGLGAIQGSALDETMIALVLGMVLGIIVAVVRRPARASSSGA